jgi:hypothetical protein
MLFFIGWKPRLAGGTVEQEKGLEVFGRWQPPEGVEFQSMWSRADGGGFGIAEVQSSEALLEAMRPGPARTSTSSAAQSLTFNEGQRSLRLEFVSERAANCARGAARSG